MVVVKKINTVSCRKTDNTLLVGISEVQLNRIDAGEITTKDISELGVPDTALLMLGHLSDITMDRMGHLVEFVALNMGVRHVFYIPLYESQNLALREGKNVRIELPHTTDNDLKCVYIFYGRTEAENEMRLECANLEVVLEKNCVVFDSNELPISESGVV